MLRDARHAARLINVDNTVMSMRCQQDSNKISESVDALILPMESRYTTSFLLITLSMQMNWIAS